MQLTLGANAALSGAQMAVDVQITGAQQLAQQLGLVWLVLDQQRKPQGTPAYLQASTAWAQATPIEHGARWQMDLNQVPAAAHSVLLVLYSFASKTTLGMVNCQIDIAQTHQYLPQLQGCTDSAMIVLELYRRNDQWKVRALGEGSSYGLAALGRRLELALDEKHPESASGGASGHPSSDDQPSQWTGTAFAISPRHLLTCAHVADEASQMQISSQQGRRRVQCIAMDRPNDLAVLLVDDQDLPSYLTIHPMRAGELGESVTALGYPLSGVMGSHLQVTQGCISSLRGYQEDIGRLQFTAPIQSGSSGSPLLDQAGKVLGMVTSTLNNAQNMNFAVKHYLMWAILDTIGFEAPKNSGKISLATLTQPQLVKQAQSSIWQIYCVR